MDDKRSLWQPRDLYQEGYDFSIDLDSEFAKKALSTEAEEMQENFNELAEETLERHNMYWASPLRFYEDACMVTSFHIGRNGTWLSTDKSVDEIMETSYDSINYHSHNVDTSSEAYALLSLVDNWTSYAEHVLEE